MNSRVVFLIFLCLHFVSTAHAFTVSGVFAMGILGQNKAAILKNGACFLPRRNVAVAPKMSPPYHLLAPIENDFFLVTLFGTLIPSVLLITLYMKSSARSAVEPTSDWGYIYLSSYVLYIRYCMCALEQWGKLKKKSSVQWLWHKSHFSYGSIINIPTLLYCLCCQRINCIYASIISWNTFLCSLINVNETLWLDAAMSCPSINQNSQARTLLQQLGHHGGCVFYISPLAVACKATRCLCALHIDTHMAKHMCRCHVGSSARKHRLAHM